MEEFDFRIIAQDGWVLDIRHTDIARNLRAVSCKIYFVDDTILGEFETCERTFEVWQALKKAAADGEKSFTFPQE